MRDELDAVVVAELRTCRDLDLVPALSGVDRLAAALGGAVADDHEDGGVSPVGEVSGRVDGPHLVGRLGRDRAVVGVGPAHAGRTVAGEDLPAG